MDWDKLEIILILITVIVLLNSLHFLGEFICRLHVHVSETMTGSFIGDTEIVEELA